MERVSEGTVVRHWLALERAKHDRDLDGPPPDDVSDRAALDELLTFKPGAAAFVWRDAPVEWYRLDLTREEFDDLHVVPGPDGLLWRALAADGTVRGCAERIADGEADRLRAETRVDVPYVLERRRLLSERDEFREPLVLSTRRGCVPRFVADGNHRAVALALALLDGRPYTPQPAYLGVGANPVFRPLTERLCGVARSISSFVR
ncbi:hypothetical protein ACFO0N_08295 [Halobium salinum]|uniref:ParB/Sulfiredoxin domain-containing protein n=1 Tax=Halobium salinum TaxID=1364940 RepID=A0ABD5PAN4_9EURY|nr:hypothetical protein [Halobium salinum]